MKLLVLGASGSVGRKVCEFGVKNGYKVTGVDLKPSDASEFEIIKLDVLNLDDLSDVIGKVKPEVIVNSLNVATIFFRKSHDNLTDITKFHVGLYPILKELKQVHYIQVGTTGSGGMGMNVPFSHGEKLSNLPLFYKAAFAGTCTILLTLLSRSFNDNYHKISEIKPGLAIFQDSFSKKDLNGVRLVTSDGGENGNYTYNELAILTAFMGFTTAQKIAEKVFSVIEKVSESEKGVKYDIIESLNRAIITEDENDTEVKNALLSKMLAETTGDYIIATGNLGPPTLTRDLILGYVISRIGSELSESEFSNKFDQDSSLCETLSYVQETNPTLYKYLKDECNFTNYQELTKFSKSGLLGWEIVREKLAILEIDFIK